MNLLCHLFGRGDDGNTFRRFTPDDVFNVIVTALGHQRQNPSGTVVTVFGAGFCVTVQNFGKTGTAAHPEIETVREQLLLHFAVFLNADVFPVVIHPLESLSFEPLKTMKLLMAANLIIIWTQRIAFIKKLEYFVIKTYEILRELFLKERLFVFSEKQSGKTAYFLLTKYDFYGIINY